MCWADVAVRFPRSRFDQVVHFIRSLGVDVTETTLTRQSLVPGIDIRAGGLHVDPDQLCEPADLLHEAAHILLTAAETRPGLDGTLNADAAEEMSAIAWTWAAALHLGIEPELVFHDEVISGNGPTLRENFCAGRYIGVPMLQWWGMTLDASRAEALGLRAYPNMLRWVR